MDLNALRVGATGRAEIWRNKGGIVVPRTQGDRLYQAEYLFPITDARSRNQFCRGKTMCVKYS
jgi:hypothetical protein